MVLKQALANICLKVVVFILLLIGNQTVKAQCIPTGMQSWDYFNISNVQINGDGASQLINFSGGDNAVYKDFTSQSVNVTVGNTYNVTIDHVKETWGNVKVKMWIDYEGNGTYIEVYDSGIAVNNNQSTYTTNASFAVGNVSIPGSVVLRVAATYHGGSITDACAFIDRAEVEDYTLNVTPISATPIAVNEELTVTKNSTAGLDNQVNVAANDYIGTTGGDSDDYAISTLPSNGSVSEISDGIFQYIPNANFLGADSFTYNLCNNINQCVQGTVSVTVLNNYCTPSGITSGIRYITNVTLPGETVTIDNDSGDGGGYEDFTHIPAADLYLGNSYDLSILIDGNTNLTASNHRSGWVAFIDFNQDGVFDTGSERVYRSGGNTGGEESNVSFPYASREFTVPFTAVHGATTMRIGMRQYWSPDSGCSTATVIDYEDYKVNIGLDPSAPQDITVTGNSSEIINGQTQTTYSNFTDFGTYDINGGAKTRVFKIVNSGSQPLVLGAVPVQLQAGSSADFSILTQPAAGTTLAAGGVVSFSISFDPSTINNNITAVVLLNSDDPDENPFTYVIKGDGQELYPDTDGDGVSNNIDIDDDNDGITDGEEQLQCLMYSNASVVETEFLNEDFGFGLNRAAINGNTIGVTTSYCYEDGVSGLSADECDADVNLNDGEYVVHYSVTNGDALNNNVTATGENIANFAHYAWYKGEDHTPGDTNGRMAIFNAATDPGVFYETAISGILPNVPVNYSFWAINIDNADNRFSSSELPRINPNITVRFLSSDYTTELASFDTGDITRCNSGNSCVDSVWKEFGTSIIINQSEFVIQFINNSPGGLGNDLALDDIRITQSLCDLDNDGVADVFDLDNDNDGIPNIYEYGAFPFGGDYDRDGLVFSGVAWSDSNGNGMHDAFEGLTGLDTDGDGTPDYLDLDSDNDSIFDVVENDGFGDLDIDGDGVGDGNDAGTGIANDNFDNDGLLALIDGNDNDADSDDHGAGYNGYNFPVDTDGDGIPDYLDVDSNDNSDDISNGSDISNTIYYFLDADNNGVIDGSTDADNDGVLDAFDSDNTLYGSPRDIEDSYSLFFDGRNDYVQDSNVISSGTASLMAWIKSEGDNTFNSNRIVAGQSNFYLMVNDSDNSVSVVLNGNNVLTSTDIVEDGIWVHLAVTINGSETILYLNGQAQGDPVNVGVVNADPSNFTIGRLANSDSNYFHGEIDEVRVFDVALTKDEVQRTVYQELNENENFNQGKIIPKNISTNDIGDNLVRYYKMDAYKGDITDNKVTPTIDQSTGAKLYNIKNIYFQTAPLPYQTSQDGLWTTEANWQHGEVWDINEIAKNKDWSIVKINNNISTTTSHTILGLIIQSDKTFNLSGDNYVDNSWYLELNGTLDLPGDSQLIQSISSDLVTGSQGKILRRQEGTNNKYRYNYWASPVGALGVSSITNNNGLTSNLNNTPFTLDLLKDEFGAAIPFTSSYDQVGSISTYWTHTYQNGYSYYNWLNFDETDVIPTGYGYSQKGVGVGTTDYQYLFEGKPNNGTIIITALDTGGPGSIGGSTRTISVLGNPYPSALNVTSFLADNSSVISGEIYLWEQWAGDTHILNQYQGGYATVNNLAGVKAYQFIGLNGDSTQSGGGPAEGVKTPTKFLPVAQGFVVEIVNDGDIKFLNSQRVFKTEATDETIFFRQVASSNEGEASNTEDVIKKIRLQLTTSNGLGREIVMGFSSVTSDEFDYGYDAKAYETFNNDLLTVLEENTMVLQAYSEITSDKVVDLTFKADGNGMYNIKATQFVDFPIDQPVFLLDNFTGTYYDLSQEQGYNFTSQSGVYTNRFDIVFQGSETLSTDGFTFNNDFGIYYNSNSNKLFAKQSNQDLKSLTLFNALGQKIFQIQDIKAEDLQSGISLKNASTGMYVVILKTVEGKILNKKIIID